MKKTVLLIFILIIFISCYRTDIDFNFTIEETFQAKISESPREYFPKRKIFLECKGNNCKIYTGSKYFKENLVYEKKIERKEEKEIKKLLKKIEKKMGDKFFIASGVYVEGWQKGKNERIILSNTHISNETEKLFNILGYKHPMVESDEKYIDSLSGEKFTYENIPRKNDNIWKLYCEEELCKVLYYKRNKDKKSSTLIGSWSANLNRNKVKELKKILAEDIKNGETLISFTNQYIMVFDNGKYYWKFDTDTVENMGKYGEVINELIKDDYKKIEKNN